MPIDKLRRRFCAGIALAPLSGSLLAKAGLPVVDVWKSPTCGCCRDWIEHLEESGFTVRAHDTGNNVVRQRLGMPSRYASCHTARISGYVVEGHVPASDVIRLLKVQPDAIGIAVPQMPVGSPGMDGPIYRGRVDPYDVLLVAKDGSATVFQSYR